jgi:hypothetical protein
MSRWLLASMIVGAGLVGSAFAPASAPAANKDEKSAQEGASRSRDNDAEGPEKRIDKAILDYQNRADQELDQTRKDIDRLKKELTELAELQFNMAISLAELQAEMRAQASSVTETDSGAGSSGSGQGSTPAEQERQRQRVLELNRELRQVRDNLGNVVQQKRNETEQLVIQLRNLRAQQRQAKADRERNKQQAANPVKD